MKILQIIPILSICLFVSCVSVPSEYRRFVELSPEQQHQVMKGLPIDKQIDYYLAGMHYTHPPEVGLADDIAQHGKQAIPFLMKRLREERDEYNQANLIYVFQVMHAFYYNLKNEREVVALIKEVADNMREPGPKKTGEDALKFILENQQPDLQEILNQ